MSQFQLIIAAIVSALAGILATLINPWLQKFKYSAIVGEVFAVADPVLKQLMPTLGSSGVYQVIRLSAAAIADGKLSDVEINNLTAYALSIFDIRAAASNGPVPVMDAAALVDNVNQSVADFKAKQKALGILPTVVTGAAGLLGTKPAVAAIKPAV